MEFLTFVVILGRQVFSNDQPGFMFLNYTNFPSQSPRFDMFLGCTCWLCSFWNQHFFVRKFLPQPSLSHRLVCGRFWDLKPLEPWAEDVHTQTTPEDDIKSGSCIQGTCVYAIYDIYIYWYNWWLIELLYIIILHTLHAMVEIDGRGPKW